MLSDQQLLYGLNAFIYKYMLENGYDCAAQSLREQLNLPAFPDFPASPSELPNDEFSLMSWWMDCCDAAFMLQMSDRKNCQHWKNDIPNSTLPSLTQQPSSQVPNGSYSNECNQDSCDTAPTSSPETSSEQRSNFDDLCLLNPRELFDPSLYEDVELLDNADSFNSDSSCDASKIPVRQQLAGERVMPHSPNFLNVTQSELEERLFFREYAFSGIQTLPQQQSQRNRICLQRLEPHVGIAESHSAKPACGALASERNNLESQVLNPYHFFPTLVVVKTTEYHFGQQRDLLCYQAHPISTAVCTRR